MIGAETMAQVRLVALQTVQRVNAAAPTQAELLAWALASMVHESKWRHPAQADAIADVGRLFALVMSGCEFERDPSHDSAWLFCVQVRYRGADYFAGARCDFENFWLPSPELLAEQPGEAWYGTRGPGGAPTEHR